MTTKTTKTNTTTKVAAAKAKVETIKSAEDAVLGLLEAATGPQADAAQAAVEAMSWGTAKTHGLKTGDSIHFGGRTRAKIEGPETATIEVGPTTVLRLADGSTRAWGAATRFWATKIEATPEAPVTEAAITEVATQAAKPRKATLKSAADVAALAPAPHLKAEQAARVGADAGPHHAGYIVRWPKPGYDLLLRTAAAQGDGPKWLVRCNLHNEVTPAAGTADGDRKGRKAERDGWCAGCKGAAQAQPATKPAETPSVAPKTRAKVNAKRAEVASLAGELAATLDGLAGGQVAGIETLRDAAKVTPIRTRKAAK